VPLGRRDLPHIAGSVARTGAFAPAIIEWGPNARPPIGSADTSGFGKLRVAGIWGALSPCYDEFSAAPHRRCIGFGGAVTPEKSRGKTWLAPGTAISLGSRINRLFGVRSSVRNVR
jgi:hypothetical protein